MPFPIIPFDPTNPALIGERPGFPKIRTSPGGGVTVIRELTCLQQHVYNWMVYFQTYPIDPYTLSGNLWTMEQDAYERQERSQGAVGIYGPAYAVYALSILRLTYESEGMRFISGIGVVREQQATTMFQEPVGIVRSPYSMDPNTSRPNTLNWSDGDALYFGEHPQFTSPGKRIIVTLPFAATSNEPFAEGTLNDNDFTMPCTGDTYSRGTLMYAGPAEKTTSVVIPVVGSVTGLARTRKSLVFHYRDPANAGDTVVDWNMRWRARDQSWLYMQDASSNPYYQWPYATYNLASWI